MKLLPPTKVIAICRAIYDQKKFRGGVKDRLLNDLFKLHLQAEVIHQEGQKVNAYLIVLSPDVKKEVMKLVHQYSLGGFITVLHVKPPAMSSLNCPLFKNSGFLLQAEKAVQAEANQTDVIELHKNAVAKHSTIIARKKAKQAIGSRVRNRQFVEGPISAHLQIMRLTLSGQMTTLPGVKNSIKGKKFSR